MGVLEGKVAVVTGAARGQGRSHCVRLAEEGADIIAVDLCATPETVSIPGSTPEDLAETVRQIEDLDRRIVARQADVRDVYRLDEVLSEGIAELGRLDIVVANAAIWAVTLTEPESLEDRQRLFRETIDIDLTGVFNTLEVSVRRLIEQGQGGAIVITSSTAGIKAMPLNSVAQHAYVAAKHGVVGLMRNYAVECAPHSIRVNTVNPTAVRSPMVENEFTDAYLAQNPHLADLMANAMPVDLVEPVDISNAILYLVSDAGRYVTGITLPVDAGFLVK
jgi:SDR family mycofactocin-dependent oxidoreductase